MNTSNVGNYAITGAGLTANFGNYVFAQDVGNNTAFRIGPALLTASIIGTMQTQSPVVTQPVVQSSPQPSLADAVNLALETNPAGDGYEDDSDNDGLESHSERHESEGKDRSEKKKVVVAGTMQSVTKVASAKSLPVCR